MKIRKIEIVFGLIFLLLTSHVQSVESVRVGITYPDAPSTEYLRRVLEALDIEYIVKEKGSGSLVEWISSDEDQKLEILNRVSQYFFLKDICKQTELPKPEQPTRAGLSC